AGMTDDDLDHSESDVDRRSRRGAAGGDVARRPPRRPDRVVGEHRAGRVAQDGRPWSPEIWQGVRSLGPNSTLTEPDCSRIKEATRRILLRYQDECRPEARA